MNIFCGVKILWIFFGGHHKNGLFSEIISIHFLWRFLGSRYRMGMILGLLKYQIFLNMIFSW